MDKITIQAVLENLDDMMEFLLNDLSKIISNKSLINQIRLSCEEVLVNVISYAYLEEKGNVEIIRDLSEEGMLFYQFIDEGVPYNPLLNTDPDINAPIEDRGIGGLGVYLYKSIMDEVKYERKDNKNILTFIKKI
ncbi:UNVERIFIED_CONTAM: anti-sigma regulatory factor (Ser/Thr protein kinase) [Acetivibrio alkalicellulosi]